jgi:alanine-glyoxylate transaminase/serine-glyoxylate transaminase/serine-pyruvate transaminase
MTAASLPDSKVPRVPPRMLLGPGPSDAHPRVIQAMMSGMIGYLDPDFMLIMDEVSELLKMVFQTEDHLTLAIAGTGSAGMEAGLNSLLEPDDTVIVCSVGFFGERMVDMAGRIGANVVPLQADWGAPFPAELLETELKSQPNVKMVAAVHAETSTGIRQPLEDLSRLSKEHDTLFMVDAVTSLGGNEVAVDRLGIDYCYSATQKCLACPPGMSPVALSPRGQDVVRNRLRKPTSWYLDLALLADYWTSERRYHHTAPVSMILALREGLRIALEEGLEARFARHHRNARALWAGLEALGLDLVAPERYRLDQITPVWIPDGIDDMAVRRALLREHSIEIGGGLGEFAGKVWRVGLMGESSKAENVLALLAALESILPGVGYEAPQGAGVSAASRSLSGA